MPVEHVNFDSQGNFTIGTGIQEMNVQKGVPTSGPPQVTQNATTGQHDASVSASVNGFNLNNLRQKAAVQVPPSAISEEPTEGPGSPEKLSVTSGAVADRTIREGIGVEAVGVESRPIQRNVSADDNVDWVASMGATLESSAIATDGQLSGQKIGQVEQVSVPASVKSVEPFNLGRIQSNAAPVAAQGNNVREDIDMANTGITAMNLGAVTAPEEASAVVKEQTEAVSAEVPFEIVTNDDMLRLCGLNQYGINSWVTSVIKAAAKAPGAVFKNAAYPDLRAFSVFLPQSSRGAVYVTLGWGRAITACSYDQKKGIYADVSAQITVDGTCAIVQGMPVASSSQRNLPAISL